MLFSTKVQVSLLLGASWREARVKSSFFYCFYNHKKQGKSFKKVLTKDNKLCIIRL